MGGFGKRNRLTSNLPQLQNLIKRDPSSYKADFEMQLQHFNSSFELFALQPNQPPEDFGDLCTFITQVSTCFPTETKNIPTMFMTVLRDKADFIEGEMRRTLVQCLILLRNRSVVSSQDLLGLFFSLFKCKDKQLRASLHTHVVSDIKNQNRKHINNKLNKVLQNFMFTLLENAEQGGEQAFAAKKAIEICIELHGKHVWNDAKTVSILAEACFSAVDKISLLGVHFFLKTDNEKDESSDEENVPDLKRMEMANRVSGKTKSKARKLDRVKSSLKKRQNRKHGETADGGFLAIHQLNDPQGFAEKLYKRIGNVHTKFHTKLLQLKLLACIIGVHNLHLSGFYTFVVRYLQPHQENVTGVLAAVAQATHDLVPPEDVYNVIRVIADRFIVDTVADEVITVGLNCVREISARQPLGMTEELLQDLTEYKNHKNKGVVMAAKSLIGLFREVNPALLKRKDRGKEASMSLKTTKPLQYGESKAVEGIDGLELLLKEGHKEEEEDGWEGWEIEEVGSGHEASSADEDDEWMSIASDEASKPPPETLQILTDEDFARIKALKRQREAPTQGQNDSEDSDAGEFVNESTIIGFQKRPKKTAEERLESVMAGREGREKFGSKKGTTERVSKNNKEKNKNKAFMMVMHKKTSRKNKMSLREKQKALRKHAIGQKKRF